MRGDNVNADRRTTSGRTIALGLAATVGRAGSLAGRTALLPARALLRAPLVRGRVADLDATGRDVEAGARRRMEATAEAVLTAPETERTLDNALAGRLPEAVVRSLVERRVVERVMESLDDEQAERIVRQVLESSEFKTMLEQVVESAAVRAVLAQQTTAVAAGTAARARRGTRRLDDVVERAPRRWLRRPPRPPETPYAGLASRGLALAVDAAIINVVFVIAAALVSLVASLVGGLRPHWLVATVGGAAWGLLVAAYFTGFWTLDGQTPGMRLMRVRVLDVDAFSPRVGRSLVRLVGLVLAIVPLCAGFLPVLVDGRRRALPDFLARTVVVYADGGGERD